MEPVPSPPSGLLLREQEAQHLELTRAGGHMEDGVPGLRRFFCHLFSRSKLMSLGASEVVPNLPSKSSKLLQYEDVEL